MNNFYNEILTEHNVRPEFKYDLECPTIQLEGVNPNCGDDIWLNLVMKDGVIQDASFNGDGCAISQASADIMIGMIIGKTKAEALHLSDLFLKMIKGTATDAEVEELEEASAL
ncbi:Fe-S cluster assembly sulfur transfer protein SufU, partial [Ruminococcus callidus]